ncbi:hypothetical protein DSCOOX_19030 [Desulfosarcina ovata subsp. ovata]|uniref:4Fe-4S ferredoxin-type domain-containing protein n=1 Tax=Desulfosarcina ovata subsp. ovata TaxID=2752305 RepID=A0A5K8A7V0_9BACT|nr:hypothetical protein DSCOOX_19030 [Desulfosarcina ovata subsp. ovata]
MATKLGDIAANECWNCKECFELRPTEALQAAYVLTTAMRPASHLTPRLHNMACSAVCLQPLINVQGNLLQ